MTKWQIVLLVILAFVLIIGISFFGLWYYKFFGPKFENIRREVFEETRSYNQAKLQELAKYKHEYEMADKSGKIAIASTIRHRFADYDLNELPMELRLFLTKTRGY